MLTNLSIKNVAVIDSLDIDFHGGVSVLTGETGAGKSIIIDSINMIIGDRTKKELVRYGCDSAFVQASFDAPESITAMLEENGIETEDGQLIITRRVTSDGKSVARINGVTVPLSLLRDVAGELVNIHGQHDSQALLTPSRHVEFLDAYAENAGILSEYAEILKNKREIEKKLASIETDEREKAQRIDLLSYQINEIKSAALRIGEEEELKKQREICQNAEQISASAEEAYANMYGGDEIQSAYDGISIAASALSKISDLSPQLSDLYERLNTIMYSIEDAAHEIKEFGEGVEFDEETLNETEERLDLIASLGRKYGTGIEEILAYGEKAQHQLNDIVMSDERAAELRSELAETEKKLREKAALLSQRRGKSAEILEKNIENSLHELNMEKARFKVSVETDDTFHDNGCDRVEFLISANPGEPPKPLVKIASGGELSRVMLAIKSVLADTDGVGTLIFDEIDTGVSGKAALGIARKLTEIGKNKQVICITHLPQLTAAADNHYLISKDTDGEMAKTSLAELDERGREEEIARMIDGREVTEIALSHAKEMRETAKKDKEIK